MSDSADLENASLLEKLDTFEVTSESIFYDEWIKETGSENGNVSPEVSWEKVDGATSYTIIMLDLDVESFILHAYSVSDTNHIDLGEMDEFFGPTPQSPHNYAVYVFALKEPVDLKLTVPTGNFNTEKLLEMLTKDNPGNVISYGSVSASYEYLSKVW